LRDLIFVHGSSPGFYAIFLYILSITGPYCLLVGFVLPTALRVLRARDGLFSSGELHIIGTIGDAVGVIFVWTFYTSRDLPTFTFLAYGFLFSFFCGYQFPLAAEMIGEWKNPASGCLAADLTGAAVGAFATGAVLIPTWGAQAAIFFLLLIKISSNIITLFISRKWRPDMSSAPRN
jgi:hypothetical protein